MALYDILTQNRYLTEAVNNIVTLEPFVLNNVFNDREQTLSDTVDVEVINGYLDIAKFKGDNDYDPDIISKTSKSLQTVKIPRTYESKVFEPQELETINAIGVIYGQNEQVKRTKLAEYTTAQLDHLKTRAIRLREKIAIEALYSGKIQVSQADLKFSLDFKFVNGKNLVSLTGGNTWDTTNDDGEYTAPIGGVIDDAKKTARGAKMGLLGANAAKWFKLNKHVREELNTNNLAVGRLDLNTQNQSNAVIYIGRYRGIDWYEYTQTYAATKNGSELPMLPDDRAVLINNERRFPYFIAPVDRIVNNTLKKNYVEFYIHSYTNQRGTMLEWEIEQKTLPTIYDLNSVVSIKVAED